MQLLMKLSDKFCRLAFLVALLFSALPLVASSGVRLSVEPARGKRGIAVGDAFYLTITVTDLKGDVAAPSSVPGANVVYFALTGQSSSMTTVNGRTTQSSARTYTATCRAKTQGDYTFGPITVAGVKSNTVSYKIGAAGSNEPPVNNSNAQDAAPDRSNDGPKFIGKGDGNLFLRASVSKTTAYEQEALVYTVKLYSSYAQIKFIGATEAPKFEGFVIEESKDVSQQLTYETYQGKTYATAVIARYIIFPQMTGSLKVLGNTYTVSVDEREYYHDPFWGQMSVSKPMQLNVSPNDLSIEVKPLPQPQPANFSGGVGHFNIYSAFPKTSLLTNQAAQAVYTVTGTGNVKYVKLPDLNVLYPSQLEVYTPTADVKAQVGSTNVTGTIDFDYSFMPLETGTFTIPAVSLVYFNPDTGQYETSVAKGTEVTVGAGKDSAKSQTKEKTVFNSELMPAGKKLLTVHRPVIRTFLYWLWFIVPVVVLVAVVVIWRKQAAMNADVIGTRSRRANKVARKRQKKAAACLKKGDSANFYDEMLAALWGYLGDKLKIPGSELNRDNVLGRLAEDGIDEAAREEVVRLVDVCEFAKYAPAASKGDMQGVYDSAARLIDRLEDDFKHEKR